MKKRFHFSWHGIFELWQCHDTLMDVYGYGKSVTDAAKDCQHELETLTSDIHK